MMRRLFNMLIAVVLLLTLSGCSKVKPPAGFVNEDDVVIKLTDEFSLSTKTKYMDNFKHEFKPRARTLTEYVFNNLDYVKSKENLVTLEEVIEDSVKIKEQRLKENLEFYKLSKDDVFGSREYRSNGKKLLGKDDYANLHNQRSKYKKVLTKSECLEDLETLDLYFRSFYGPYKVMTREKFDEAYNKTCEVIKNLDTNEITNTRFFEIICNNYDMPNDGHFRWKLNGEERRNKGFIDNKTDGFYYDSYYFLKDDKGYYLKDYLPKTYLESVKDDPNVSNYMQYTILNDGELAYMIAYLDLENTRNRNIEIKVNGQEFIVPVEQMNGLDYKDDSHYSFTLEDGYPVVKVKHYRNGGEQRKDIDFDHLANLGYDLRGQNVIIKDTRGNMGGAPINVSSFLDNLFPGLNKKSLCLGPNGGIEGGMDKQWRAYFFRPYESIYDNKELLINLSDANGGSGGDEIAISMDMLRYALNIGEPTMGCLITGCPNYSLPISGISASIAPQISIDQAAWLRPDGTGQIPNIWVKSIDALDKTIKMLKYYDVKPSDSAKEIVNKKGVSTNDVFRSDLRNERKNDIEFDYYNTPYKTRLVIDAKEDEDNLILSFEYLKDFYRKGKVRKTKVIDDTPAFVSENQLVEGSTLLFNKKELIKNQYTYNSFFLGNEIFKYRIIPNS